MHSIEPEHSTPPVAATSSPASRVATQLTPILPGERMGSLDLLRGIALLGILMVNMPLFAFPLMIGFGDASLADDPVGDQIAWGIVSGGFQYSFISLFSLLFGAGFIMMSSRAEARGSSVVFPYLRRSLLLLLFGLSHVVLLWMGDILFLYGLLALPLLLLRSLPWKVLVGLGAGLVCFGIVTTTASQALSSVFMGMSTERAEQRAEEPETQSNDQLEEVEVVEDLDLVAADDGPPRGFKAMLESEFNVMDPIWIEAETAAHLEGPFATALVFRLVLWGFGLLSALFTFGWIVFGFFLVGAGLMKCDYFARDVSDAVGRWQLRLAWLLPLGLLLKGTYVTLLARAEWEQSLPIGAASGLHVVGAALGTIGLVSIGCMIVRYDIATPLVRLIGNAGRMALTLYLMQSLVVVAIMDYWGLARFGSFDRMSLIGMTVAVWVAQVLFANLWFTTFRMGPLEWLWRLATYLRPAALR